MSLSCKQFHHLLGAFASGNEYQWYVVQECELLKFQETNFMTFITMLVMPPTILVVLAFDSSKKIFWKFHKNFFAYFSSFHECTRPMDLLVEQQKQNVC